MKQLPLPDTNYKEDFNSIMEDKREPHKNQLFLARPAVFADCALYILKAQELQQVRRYGYSPDQEEALLHCYTSSTQSLRELKKRIKQPNHIYLTSLCVYCGVNSPNSFDHYLDKGTFPEFAVFSHNLVPSCLECNLIKNQSHCKTIYFYADQLQYDKIWLRAEIGMEGNTPIAKVYLDIPASFSPAHKNLISNHYNTLQLIRRIREKSAEYLANMVSELRPSIHLSEPQLAQHLATVAQGYAQTFGANYPKAVIMQGAANCSAFIQAVKSGVL